MDEAKVNEKLAKSLTAEDIELIEYLPYLLQDLWDLGSSPEDIILILEKHAGISKETRVLDLACGKGAVSVKIAEKFGCNVTGIDIINEFIEFAKEKASEYNVTNLCGFKTEDANKFVETQKDFDVVIFGAVGDVLGSPEETIEKLKKTIKPDGYIVIDDAYGIPGSSYQYPTKNEFLILFDKLDLILIADKVFSSEKMAKINNFQQPLIAKRAAELKEKFPEKSELFDGYVRSQLQECEEIENDLNCVTMLLTFVGDSSRGV